MDEIFASQFQLDFRTGVTSAIHGSAFCADQRSACIALNRLRARGILETNQLFAPGEQVSLNVWETTFARRAREWQLPLISLDKLGIHHDRDGLRSSAQHLPALPSGAEACPYKDLENEVVYKLFDLRGDGSLGKKLLLELNHEDEAEMRNQPAELRETLEKLSVLNEAGAHPTEIVGLSNDGHYLVVKQPLARPSENFLVDREEALKSIRAVVPNGTRLRTTIAVIWMSGQTWLVGDLHERNIMRDGDGRPTIIDALIGPAPPLAMQRFAWLRNASADARALREDRPLPERKLFDDVDDDSL